MQPPEGSWYAPGTLIMRFQTGEQFAKEYGQKFFSDLSGQQVRFEASQPDPIAEAQYPRQELLPGAFVSVGMAQFSIFSPQKPGVGIVAAIVIRNPIPGGPGGFWNVSHIHRLAVTDPAVTPLAFNMLRHMISTFVFEQKWLLNSSKPGGGEASTGYPPPMGSPGTTALNADSENLWRDVQKAQTDMMLNTTKKAQEVYDRVNDAWDDQIKS